MQEAADRAARELLTPRETARFLSVDEGTLANWRSAGTVRLPYCRVGRAVRYRRSALEMYLQANTFGNIEG